MKPAPFDYHRPETLAGALECMATLEDVRPLAGGQSLMPMMNFRYVMPEHVVDLNRIGELAEIGETEDGLLIGAMVRQRALERSPEVAARCPLLREALGHVGHVQTRNRGTLGGSLSHLDPAAELPAVLAACDAVLEVRSARGVRRVPMSEWSRGYMTPNLGDGELLCAVHIPAWPEGHGYAFEEIARRHGDFALAGAAVLVSLDAGGLVERVAIALAGVGDAGLRLHEAEQMLIGGAADAAQVERAAELALNVPGLADTHAGKAYRQKLAAVVTRRALLRAMKRARAK